VGGAAGSTLSADEAGWLIDGDALPASRAMVSRGSVESALADMLQNFGAGVLVGSSGLGKTNLARAAAIARSGTFTIVDLRDNDPQETRRRLDTVFARVGGIPSPVLILEDLNHLVD
jgi:hypothetical protein